MEEPAAGLSMITFGKHVMPLLLGVGNVGSFMLLVAYISTSQLPVLSASSHCCMLLLIQGLIWTCNSIDLADV
jgi:hypothetical protein